MTNDLPDPLVGAEVDLSDFQYMPLMVTKLRRSKQWLIAKRKPEIGFYAVNLWAASWHEKPAASLEDDDDQLADLAMCDPKRWPKVRDDVMRGWIKCSDGRLYHTFVAERANESWTSKLAQRARTQAAREARLAKQNGTTGDVTASSGTLTTDSVTENVTASKVREGKVRDKDIRGSQGASSPPKDVKKGTRLPADWTISAEWRDWALQRGAEPSMIDREAERFGNYWPGAPGGKGLKLDWFATWRNWMLDKLPAAAPLLDGPPRKSESPEIERWRGRLTCDEKQDYWDFQTWGDPWNDPRHEVPQSLLDEFPTLREKYTKLRLVK